MAETYQLNVDSYELNCLKIAIAILKKECDSDLDLTVLKNLSKKLWELNN